METLPASATVSDAESDKFDKILALLRFSLAGKWAKLAIEEEARR